MFDTQHSHFDEKRESQAFARAAADAIVGVKGSTILFTSILNSQIGKCPILPVLVTVLESGPTSIGEARLFYLFTRKLSKLHLKDLPGRCTSSYCNDTTVFKRNTAKKCYQRRAISHQPFDTHTNPDAKENAYAFTHTPDDIARGNGSPQNNTLYLQIGKWSIILVIEAKCTTSSHNTGSMVSAMKQCTDTFPHP